MAGLVTRMTNGLGSNKYKQVDYNKLRATVSEKRYGSIKNGMKVAKIEQMSHQHKENTILKQHQLIWQKEFIRQQHLRKKIQGEVDDHFRANRNSDICGQIYSELDYIDASQSEDFNAFKKATADPVWNLRDDLRYWLTEKKEEVKYGSPEVIEEHNQVRAMVDNVKTQQEEVMRKLEQEQRRLEAELRTDTLLELCPPALHKRPAVAEGVPLEALQLPCPDSKLKSQLLQEFIIQNDKFRGMIEELQSRHAKALSLDDCGGWEADDHFTFVAVHDQYPRDMGGRRRLLVDRLRRHLPHMSQRQLFDHEDWWLDYKYYYERLKGICTDWNRDRRELLAKVHVVSAEAAAAAELEEVRQGYQARHRALCDLLYDKVKVWREQKMEAMALRAQIDEENRQIAEERFAQQQQEETKRRLEEKKKVQKFTEKRQAERLAKQRAAEERLQELNAALAEQAVYDRQRIQYREEQLAQKLEGRKEKEGLKLQEEEEKEARLEALRMQVRVVAESDPDRAMQGTQAWMHHLETDDVLPINKPLFDMKSFAADQITSDKRVRLETQLRAAGLHTSDYARKIIRGATPPRPVQQHQLHTFKFSDGSS